MLFFYINSTDRTADIEAGSFIKINQIQQRSDSCEFTIFQNSKPSENQDIKVYDGGIVESHAGTSIVLKESYQESVNAFRAGQEIWISIGESDIEKVTIDSYNEATRTITLTASPSVSLSEDDQVGELIFGGIVSRIKDENEQNLNNIVYHITGVDYGKIFDKKDVSDTWEDVDARYIINSFVNSTVNYNSTIDDIDYDDNTAIQAEWIEAGDGSNPTVDSSDYLEGDASGVFSWTNSGGTASWAATPTSKDLSEFFGVSSGMPTKGQIMSWLKTSDQSDITSLKVRIGSDSSNYVEWEFDLTSETDWDYYAVDAVSGNMTGTPDWTVADYAALVIVETGNGQIKWNGLRVNAQNSFTLNNVEATPSFDDFRSPHTKPTALINSLAKYFDNIWYIDYEKDIHFKAKETDPSPFDITDTSDNFTDLKIEIDTANLGNRIKIFGGEKTSASVYAQVFEGNNSTREWVLKSKFKNLAITIDDNSSTDTMEAGTTTTTVNATGHNLTVGDHIVNRTRSNAVRVVLTTPTADQFTVEAVTGQTNGDTFSKFATSKTDGIEGITDETTVDYVANSNEKSVRATDSEVTLDAGDFIRFVYNERIPIQLQYTNSASANALRAAGMGDGIFDLDNIVDRNIQDTATALAIAKAKVDEFSNPVITGSFKTDQKGFKAGQLLRIEETTGRSVDDTYVIQTVKTKQDGGGFKDNLEFTVTFGTTLFGWIEFMQKLLRTAEGLEQNVNDIVETFIDSLEVVEAADTNMVGIGGINTTRIDENVDVADTNAVTVFTPPWKWEPNGAGQPLNTRWGLFEWG